MMPVMTARMGIDARMYTLHIRLLDFSNLVYSFVTHSFRYCTINTISRLVSSREARQHFDLLALNDPLYPCHAIEPRSAKQTAARVEGRGGGVGRTVE